MSSNDDQSNVEIQFNELLNLHRNKRISNLDNQEYVVSRITADPPINSVVVISNSFIDFENYKNHQLVFDGKERVEQLEQIAKGLQFLHNNDLIHRDINPSSVSLQRTGQNKVVAKLAMPKEQNQNGDPLNNWCKAPECHRRVWDKTTDVFALGILFYYWLTEEHHPFAPDLEQNDFNGAIKKIKELKALPKFTKLRKSNRYGKVQMVTLVGLIQKMIHRVPRHRLTIEKVLCHPAFYDANKKLNFLLTVHEYINAPLKLREIRQRKNGKIFDDRISNQNLYEKEIWKSIKNIDLYEWKLMYDEPLCNDIQSKVDKGKLKFELSSEEIFKEHNYFKDKLIIKSEHDTRIQLESKWRSVDGIKSVSDLLKALRNKVAHACDPYPDVPLQFINDFREGNDIFEYKSEKFLEVFLSSSPALVVHLYEFFRDELKVAREFYPK